MSGLLVSVSPECLPATRHVTQAAGQRWDGPSWLVWSQGQRCRPGLRGPAGWGWTCICPAPTFACAFVALAVASLKAPSDDPAPLLRAAYLLDMFPFRVLAYMLKKIFINLNHSS